MTRVAAVVSALFLALAVRAEPAQDAQKRLNNLFFWLMSEELKLKPETEKDFTATVGDLQKRRQDSLQKREGALAKLKEMGKHPKGKACQQALGEYREATETLAGLDAEEYKKLEKILGSEQLARYYVVREEILARVQEAIKKQPAQ